jgi:ABC-type phosphate transport system substrate-binding protein
MLAVLDGGRSNARATEGLVAYQDVSSVEGTLHSIGLPSHHKLMTRWAEAFQKHYPKVKLQLEGPGAITTPPKATQGLTQLGPIPRKLKPEEEQAFEKKRGFKATCLQVALALGPASTVRTASYQPEPSLYIYVPKHPKHALHKVNQEFLKFVLSQEGQQLAVECGYRALPPAVVAREMELLK